jgi:hypothetical protein
MIEILRTHVCIIHNIQVMELVYMLLSTEWHIKKMYAYPVELY